MNAVRTEEEAMPAGRVVLRRLGVEDAEAVAGYRSLAEVARYQSWEAGYSVEAARRLCAESAGAVWGAVGAWAQFGIVEVSRGVLVGDCGGCFRAGWVMEVGVTLSPLGWGRGLGSAAVCGLRERAFGEWGTRRVIARVDVMNVAAARMFERCGFRVAREDEVMFKGAVGRELLFECER